MQDISVIMDVRGLLSNDLKKMIGSLDSNDVPVEVEPFRKFSLLSKSSTLKIIENASQLKLQGK